MVIPLEDIARQVAAKFGEPQIVYIDAAVKIRNFDGRYPWTWHYVASVPRFSQVPGVYISDFEPREIAEPWIRSYSFDPATNEERVNWHLS